MGFQLENCISPEDHTSEFVCAVCFQLPDISDSVVTSCAHCFCRGCLREWFSVQGRGREGGPDLGDSQNCPCPSCKSICRMSEVSTLKAGQPLAFRVFGRIKVRCPLHEQDCKWQGHYSEVQAHLTSSSDHISSLSNKQSNAEADADADLRTATALKDQANERFQARNFEDALKLYTKAISVCPDRLPECYVNRSLTYLVLRQYTKSIADAQRAVIIRPNYAKAYSRGAKALVELDRFEEAEEFLAAGIEACSLEEFAQEPGDAPDADNPSKKAKTVAGVDLTTELAAVRSLLFDVKRGEEMSRAGRHAEARQVFSSLLQRTSAKRVMVLAAEQESLAGNTERALRLTLQVLRIDPNDSRALLARARAMVFAGDIDGAQAVLREMLRQSPDDRQAQVLFRQAKALKGVLNQANNSRLYYDAVAIYSIVLSQEGHTPATATGAENSSDQPEGERSNSPQRTAASDAMAFFLPAQSDPVVTNEERVRRQLGVAETVEKTNRLSLPWIPRTTPLSIQLHADRANALFRLKLYAACLKDCAYAIYHQDDCKRAWLTKTYALIEMGFPGRAVEELDAVMAQWGQNDPVIKGAYEKAVFEDKRRKRVNYYEVLHVPSVASEPEIKAAYKREALIWHPDRVKGGNSTTEQGEPTGDEIALKAEAERKFKLLGEALEYLGDPVKRKLFDEGYDKAGIDERIARAERSHRH